MLAKKAFLLKATLFKDTSRSQVVREHMGGDLDQPELLKSVLANSLNHGGHDATAPKWLPQPVANLASMRLADLEAIETAAADQGVVSAANCPMNRLALLLGDVGD